MTRHVQVALTATLLLVLVNAGFAIVRGASSDTQLEALRERVTKLETELRARQKIGALILDMDAKEAAQRCKHEGPYFIAEDSQGTFCLDCGAKIKD